MSDKPRDVVASYIDSLLCDSDDESQDLPNNNNMQQRSKQSQSKPNHKPSRALNSLRLPLNQGSPPVLPALKNNAPKDVVDSSNLKSQTQQSKKLAAEVEYKSDDRGKLQRLLAPKLAPVSQLATDAAPVIPATPNPVRQPNNLEPDPKKQPSAVSGQAPSALLAWMENGRPVWAQERFEVLLFQVCGLTLSVPLVALGHIHRLTDELTPVFGQADWFMGLQPTPSGSIRCINTALFVMPDRYDCSFLKTAKYVVSIEGMDWGLAVDQVHQPSRIHPDEVTWRSKRSKRPWLAGTIKTAMCALIDVPSMGQILENLDSNRQVTP